MEAILISTCILLFAVIAILAFKIQGTAYFKGAFDSLKESGERVERMVKEEIFHNRTELMHTIKTFEDSLLSRMKEKENSQKNQLDIFSQQLAQLARLNEEKLENVRQAVQERLRSLQEENSARLEQMRLTVDEKLHSTLKTRLTESFEVVSKQLESVYKGLGEMQTLASSVGDLEKILKNVKVRGNLGEIQLGMLLEQMLTHQQYATNIVTKQGSNERVEYAVRLPGAGEGDEPIWLPIDAKFPQEDYQRLLEAQESGDVQGAEKWARQLETRIKNEARAIRDKYIYPPYTTEFGIMYLPTEGLFAEVLRRPGLFEAVQRDFHMVITGPTTLTAVLNSLQMGFRTLAIQKRSGEVWRLLGTVKNEFAKFADILIKTRKKLEEATKSIDAASSKTRNIQSKLNKVGELPGSERIPLAEEEVSPAADEPV